MSDVAALYAAGQRVGDYELLGKLGAGGMGVVYKARDLVLDRTVALKFLSQEDGATPRDKERLLREARAASSLDHVNIGTIHGIRETGEGHLFIVMAFYEGESLRGRMRRLGPLPPAQVVDLAIQIAEGLAAAHAKGIVHRDVKPGNVMITTDGIVKVVDFGLARVSGGASTQSAVIVGSAPYMSPEQALGRTADRRSDIWSLGVVISEMATGRLPFVADSMPAILFAIVNAAPAGVDRAPAALQPIIYRALAKDPGERYQNTREMIGDLKAQQVSTDTPTLSMGRSVVPGARKVSRRRWATILLVCLLAVAGALGWRQWMRPRLPQGPRLIAILPFHNIGADEPFCDGIVETLTTSLSELERFHSSLMVVPASEVRSQGVDNARAARRAFGVNYVITGSVQREPGGVRLTANLVDAGRAVQVGARSIVARADELHGLQDKVVTEVAAMLDLHLEAAQRAELAAGGTKSADASGMYLTARGYLQRYDKPGNLERAVELLQAAIAKDPKYALALAALSEARWIEYQYGKTHAPQLLEDARLLAQRAMEIAPDIPSPHIGLGLVHSAAGRYADAIREYSAALKIDPRNAEALRNLAQVYEASGKTAEAEQTYRNAVQLRADDWQTHNWLGIFLYRRGRYHEAEQVLQEAARFTPDNFLMHANLGSVHHAMGRLPQAEADYRRSLELKATARGFTGLGAVLHSSGRYRESVEQNERAAEMSPNSYTVLGNLGDSYRWTPELARKAPEAFRRAVENADRALARNPSDAFARSCRALYEAKLARNAQALTDIAAARQLAPGDIRILENAVVIEEMAHQRKRALEDVAQALEMEYAPWNFERDPELADLVRDARFQSLKEEFRRKHANNERN